MLVKELIKELQECDGEATVDILLGNEDEDVKTYCDFEVHHKDNQEHIELFVDVGFKED